MPSTTHPDPEIEAAIDAIAWDRERHDGITTDPHGHTVLRHTPLDVAVAHLAARLSKVLGDGLGDDDLTPEGGIVVTTGHVYGQDAVAVADSDTTKPIEIFVCDDIHPLAKLRALLVVLEGRALLEDMGR